uniref:Uncharacterized protein n=1 Tax=Rhizophora mucronata TaxID=61149 RepID=A0A2P2P790_RHIMU
MVFFQEAIALKLLLLCVFRNGTVSLLQENAAEI